MTKYNLRNKVEKLTKLGYTAPEIAKELGISKTSVGAYKAHITRGEQIKNELEKYVNSKYIILETKKINAKLDQGEKSQLLKILEKLENENKKPKKRSTEENNLRELLKSEIRKKVIALRKQGLPNNEIYPYFPEKLMRNVSAYCSHVTMGTYERREVI